MPSLLIPLAEYAKSHGLCDTEFKTTTIHFALGLSIEGKFISFIPCGTKKNPKRIVAAAVPKTRSLNIEPLLACDSVGYILGPGPLVTDPGRIKRLQQKYESHLELMGRAYESTKNALLKACCAFYADEAAIAQARLELGKALNDEKDDGIVVMEVDDRFVIEDEEVKSFWREEHARKRSSFASDRTPRMCSITGNMIVAPLTHSKAKDIIPISRNVPAMQTYGCSQGDLTPVSQNILDAAAAGLSHLMDQTEERSDNPTIFKTGDINHLVFVEESSADFNFSKLVHEGSGRDILDFFSSVETGKPHFGFDEGHFSYIAYSQEHARLTQLECERLGLPEIKKNLADYFSEFSVIGFKGKPVYTGISVISGMVKLSDVDSLDIMRRAIYKRNLGPNMLSKAVIRFAAKHNSANEINLSLVSFIRLCLNDSMERRRTGGKMENKLDEERNNTGYLLGRIQQMFASLQRTAQMKLSGKPPKTTNADRLCGAAMQSPRVVFIQLSSSMGHYLDQLKTKRPGAAVRIERMLNGLMARIGQVPARFTLADQAEFVLGFAHQKVANILAAKDFKKKQAK